MAGRDSSGRDHTSLDRFPQAGSTPGFVRGGELHVARQTLAGKSRNDGAEGLVISPGAGNEFDIHTRQATQAESAVLPSP